MRRECGLCGEREDIEPSVVRWTDGSFESINRCLDRDGCYRRLRDRGEDWPVIDAKPGIGAPK